MFLALDLLIRTIQWWIGLTNKMWDDFSKLSTWNWVSASHQYATTVNSPWTSSSLGPTGDLKCRWNLPRSIKGNPRASTPWLVKPHSCPANHWHVKTWVLFKSCGQWIFFVESWDDLSFFADLFLERPKLLHLNFLLGFWCIFVGEKHKICYNIHGFATVWWLGQKVPKIFCPKMVVKFNGPSTMVFTCQNSPTKQLHVRLGINTSHP